MGMMKRDFWLRVIIVGAGAVLFLLLFFADKTNLDGKESLAVQETIPSPETSVANLPPFPEDQPLKGQVERLPNVEGDRKLALLDSIVAELRSLDLYPFAADFAAQKLQLQSSLPNRLETGGLARRAMELDYVQSDSVLARRYRDLVIFALEPVVQEDPENEQALLDLGLAYIRSQAPMQGILSVRKVLEINPKNVEAAFRLGEFSLQTGQIDKAIQRFETVLSVENDHYPAMYGLAVALAQANRSGEAKSYLEQVIDKTPEDDLRKLASDLLNQID